MSAEIHKLGTANRPEQARYRQLLDNIRDCLNDRLSTLLSRMFDSADDTLFKLAENAETNEEQSQYFDTMRLLRLERKNVTRHFTQALQACTNPQQTQAQDDIEEELSLVDQDEMEEMVAIATMHSKAMNSFGDSINHLEARLEVLAMKWSGCIDKQALAPKNIGEAFKQSLLDVELNTKSKLIVYKLFDQEVILQLEAVYQAINKILIDADILPQIKLEAGTPRQAPTRQTQTTIENTGYQSQPGTQASVAATGQPEHAVTTGQALPHAEINRVINQFLHGETTASGPGIPASFSAATAPRGNAKEHYYDRRDILFALSNLQTNLIEQNEFTEFVDAETIKRALMIDMGSRHGGTLTKRVNQIDEKTIDFIEMLFEVIAEDNSISDIMTNLLLRLQIPVIKVAMLDQEFFASNQHPARHLLNLIAEIGTGINDRNDETYAALEHIVDELLKKFDADVISFQLAVDQLNELIIRHQKTTEDNEKQTQKQVLQEHARQVVLTELQYRIGSKSLPKAVHSLVLKHWATLMFHRYIRSGKDSAEWNNAVELLNRLLTSLQPIENQSQWQYLQQNSDNLAQAVQHALYETRQDREKVDQALRTLTDTFRAMLDNSEYGTEDYEDEVLFADTGAFDALPEVEAEEIEPTPLQQQISEAREKISRLPSDVRPGVWFEIFDGEDRPMRRLKLSVIIMEEARLVFVDRTGVKVLEKDASVFVDELENDRSRPIADHSVFDHALSQVIHCLSAAS